MKQPPQSSEKPPARATSSPVPDSPNSDAPSPELIATAFHEAGHAVMALSLGRSIDKVTISPRRLQVEGVRLGACKIQKGRTKSSRDWLEDEVLILFAGMVAEATITGHYCEKGAAQDLRTARRLLHNRPATPRQMERIERRLIDKTAYRLGDEGHAKAIELIAKELLLKTTISGRAVRHFFNMAVKP
ncbi:ATP-dependent zinc metalloprotease FtsH [Novipirellula galeiformis]|uniref:ATP-dependent zinc metalloprotease FtsH n=1 Tax=Novipirellula galeiformis TaxID=2528004 RepID=A0A5C6CJD1_9BACT|nr:M50 family metallopeptidase [Novipirellula galeiformis]TWU24953.1 ATP-dependent zinc metalloprotease FtsH [Novipirellula galeiformis]